MDDLKIVFQAAKIVGVGVDGDAYRRQLPGVERGHQDFVMSRSELMLFSSCPSRWVRGFSPKETSSIDYGALIDCLLMDKARFEQRFALQPKTVKATKSMKCVQSGDAEIGDDVPWSPNCGEAVEWRAAQGDKAIVTPKEDSEVKFAINRLFENEKIRALFECSQFQVMVVGEYVDKATGIVVPIKALLDLVPAADSMHCDEIADFKSARSAHPRAWAKAIDERNYDAQAALFLDLYVAATGEPRNTFLHVVQENAFPFEPDCRMLSADFLNLGRGKVLSALRDYCQCLAAKQWPSWPMERLNGWGLCQPESWMAGRYTEPLNLVERKETVGREEHYEDVTP